VVSALGPVHHGSPPAWCIGRGLVHWVAAAWCTG